LVAKVGVCVLAKVADVAAGLDDGAGVEDLLLAAHDPTNKVNKIIISNTIIKKRLILLSYFNCFFFAD
jgi:hypothetical protein